MSQPFTSRDLAWSQALAGSLAPHPGDPASLRIAGAELDDYPVRSLVVVPDPDNPFPHARQSEGGLLEGWGLAAAVDGVLKADHEAPRKYALLTITDVPSRAYGHREEALGIHQALAEAMDAYARTRLAGHSLIGLLVSKAMSGASLAHGYQANRLIVLYDPGVTVHTIGKATTARTTLRSIEELEASTAKVPPVAYDIGSYALLGLLWRILPVETAEVLSAADLMRVHTCLDEALANILGGPHDLGSHLSVANRETLARMRRLLREQW